MELLDVLLQNLVLIMELNYTQNSATIGAYTRLNLEENTISIMGYEYSAFYSVLRPRFTTGVMYGQINSDTQGGISGSVADSLGLSTIVRSVSNMNMYRNNSLIDSSINTSGAIQSWHTNVKYLILASDDGNGPRDFTRNQVSSAFIGGTLTAADVSTMYLATNAYLNAVSPELIVNGGFDSTLSPWGQAATSWQWQCNS